jgi:GntR family transcriptional repressor for pyruvate dehydrogenase complex
VSASADGGRNKTGPGSGDAPRASPLRTIKRTQRSEEIRRQIEDAIRSGDFAPGERLPSERELVETFGVSRVSVREAIRSLEAVGLVRVYQGRGAFVSDRRSGFGEPMARWLEIHRDEALELLGVRGALDEYAAQLAADHAKASQLEAIERANTAFAAAVDAGAPAAELVIIDIDFHIAIAEAGGNRLLYDLLSDLHSYLAESRYVALLPANRPRQSAAEHESIVAAIRARDSDAAVAAAANHIASVRKVLVANAARERRRRGSAAVTRPTE